MLLLNLSAIDLSLLPADRLDSEDEIDINESLLKEPDEAVDILAGCSLKTEAFSLEQFFLKDVSAAPVSVFLCHSLFKPYVEIGLNLNGALFSARVLFSLLISGSICVLLGELAANLFLVFSR